MLQNIVNILIDVVLILLQKRQDHCFINLLSQGRLGMQEGDSGPNPHKNVKRGGDEIDRQQGQSLKNGIKDPVNQILFEIFGAAALEHEEGEIGRHAAASHSNHDRRGIRDESYDYEEDQGCQHESAWLYPCLSLHELELLGLVKFV